MLQEIIKKSYMTKTKYLMDYEKIYTTHRHNKTNYDRQNKNFKNKKRQKKCEIINCDG